MAVGGLAVFPSDTVYGLACGPEDRFAVERLYLLKRRPREKPAAIMFFDPEFAFSALPELGSRTREALERLLPGAVGALLPNPRGRFPLACGGGASSLGLRVPAVERLADVRVPVLQSSANRAGEPDPRTLSEVPELFRAAVDLVIDGGELPGTPSTVIDLRSYEQDGSWSVVREGAVSGEELLEALGGPFHFDPVGYPEMIREEIPVFDRLQDELVGASGTDARRLLELGTGTGETARRLLQRHPKAFLVGVDSSVPMLSVARATLPRKRVELHVGRLQDPLPSGPFDLAASALAVHHLDATAKAGLFARVRDALNPGGRFVLADVVVPPDPADAIVPLTPGLDSPSSVDEQLEWLAAAGFEARLCWAHRDLAVIAAEVPGR